MNATDTPPAQGGTEQAENAATPPQDDLYGEELERYRATLNRDLELAFRRYGFTLYHSLEGVESVELRHKLGFKPLEATDHYNLGLVAVHKEDFAAAAAAFAKALEIDSTISEAEYNLAMALAKAGDAAGAKKRWTSYLKRHDLSEADRAAAQGHLAELG